ncbi:hypothetical protein WUBG_18572, partial [Wuchereria bancrofti]
MKEALLEIACLIREKDISQQEIQTKIDGIVDNFNETEVIELSNLWLTISEEAMIEAQGKFENGNYTWEAVETDNFENELLFKK